MKLRPGLITIILFPFILGICFAISFGVVFFNGNIRFEVLHIFSGIPLIVFVSIITLFLSGFAQIFTAFTRIFVPQYIVFLISALLWIIGCYFNTITKSYSGGFSYSAFRDIMINKGVLTPHGELVALTYMSYEVVSVIISLVIYLYLRKLKGHNN